MGGQTAIRFSHHETIQIKRDSNESLFYFNDRSKSSAMAGWIPSLLADDHGGAFGEDGPTSCSSGFGYASGSCMPEFTRGSPLIVTPTYVVLFRYTVESIM